MISGPPLRRLGLVARQADGFGARVRDLLVCAGVLGGSFAAAAQEADELVGPSELAIPAEPDSEPDSAGDEAKASDDDDAIDDDDDDAIDDDEIEVSEEVIVYGQLRVDQARQKVIDDLSDLGYSKVIEKDDAVVLRHESAWKGDVWLHDDGWMRIKRQPVRVEAPGTPWGKKNSAGAWMGCILYPFLCVKPGGQTVGTRKFRGVESRTASAVQGDVEEWAARVADLAIDRKAEELPDRLQRLWDDGVPLAVDLGASAPSSSGEDAVEAPGWDPIETPADRRAAILEFWGSRTDNEWGEAIREVVERFCRGVIQHSEHPFTEAEIRAFNRVSRAARPFTLERRVTVDD